MNNNFTIVTVLRSGGDFTPDHVRWFARQCACVAPDVPFVCLSDTDVPFIRTVPIKRFWPGWWSKVELFDHFTNALYFDLDTVLVGDIDHLINFVPNGLLGLRPWRKGSTVGVRCHALV